MTEDRSQGRQEDRSGERSDDLTAAEQRELEALQLELEAARGQLADLERLLGELPQVFERKFQERLEPMLEHQRLIAEENQILLDRAHHVLGSGEPSGGRPALPEGRSEAAQPIQARQAPSGEAPSPAPPPAGAIPQAPPTSAAPAPTVAPLTPAPRAAGVAHTSSVGQLSNGGTPDPKPSTAKPVTPKPITPKPSQAKPSQAKPNSAKPSTLTPSQAKPNTSEPHKAEPNTANPNLVEPTIAEPAITVRHWVLPRWVPEGISIVRLRRQVGLLGLSIAVAALAAGGVVAWRTLLRPQPSTVAAEAEASRRASQVVVFSSTDLSWLAVRDADGATLFEGELTGERRFPLGRGLTVMAGRPDLVTVKVGKGLPRPLGRVDQVDWLVIKAP